MARIELLKHSFGGIVTSSTHQNITKESVLHPPAKCQLVHHNRPFHIPVTLQTGCSYYPNVATKLCQYETCQSVTQLWQWIEYYNYQESFANCYQ